MFLNHQKIQTLCKKYPISALYLFGSHAIGKANEKSDYDFGILLSPYVKKERYVFYKLLFIRELQKVVPSEFVDVVILNDKQVPLLLKYNIIKEGKLLYEKEPNHRVYEEARIMTFWFDQEYFERLWFTNFTKNLAQGKIL